MGPFEMVGSIFLGAVLGPFKATGDMSQEQCWVHSEPSAVSPMRNAGPIEGCRQHFSKEVLVSVGNVAKEHHWSH